MNMSIPDAAVELGVSETRLRKTLTEIAVPTLVEFRRTRTGVRKTTVLGADAVSQLRAYFEAPLPWSVAASAQCAVQTAAPAAEDESEQEIYSPQELRFLGIAPSGERSSTTTAAIQTYESSRSFGAEAPVEPHGAEEPQEPREETSTLTVACRQEHAPPRISAGSGQSVPVAQFNALLYQHNVLREELTRVSDYLEGCDRLLGEMVRTISTLEERTRQLEYSPRSARGGNPLSGALRSVSAGVQNALFARGAPAMLKPTEVYYANVLTGR